MGMRSKRLRDVMEQPGVVAERRKTPVTPASFTADVGVPAMTTILSSLFIGVPLGTLTHLALLSAGVPNDLLAMMGLVGGLVLMVAWVLSLWLSIERGQVTEEIYYQAGTAKPADVALPRQIEFEEGRPTPYGMAIKRFDLKLPEGIGEAEFLQFCQQTLRTDDFSETAWCGEGGQFSRPAYGKLRQQLMQPAVALIEWKNEQSHAQGVRLTDRGRRVFGRLAQEATSPPSKSWHTGAISRKRV